MHNGFTEEINKINKNNQLIQQKFNHTEHRNI